MSLLNTNSLRFEKIYKIQFFKIHIKCDENESVL